MYAYSCNERAMYAFQDHDGDGRPPAARLPLHRSESHSESADTLNGASRSEFWYCIQRVQRGTLVLYAAAVRNSGSNILLQMNLDIEQSPRYKMGPHTGFMPSVKVCLHLLRVICILDILIFILHCIEINR